jgi:hypothetical protein
VLAAGDTFVTEHLWFVLSDPDANGEVVCVSLTSHENHEDGTTICRRGEHPFITHDSIVLYASARRMQVAAIEAAINATIGRVRRDARCSDELLERIRRGAIQSVFTPNGIKKACMSLWVDG